MLNGATDVSFELIAAVICVCSNKSPLMAANPEVNFELIAAIIFVFALDSVANTAIVSFSESMLSTRTTSSGNRRTLRIHFMKLAIDFMNRPDIS